jgi:hypothetical protein
MLTIIYIQAVPKRLILLSVLFCLVFSCLIGLENTPAVFVENGRIELPKLSDWNTFTTPNGTLGGSDFPGFVDFDTKGDGEATKSMVFRVGQRTFKGRTALHGGGIYTSLWLKDGQNILAADIASAYSSPKDKRNLAGGLFELLVDGQVIAHHDFGSIETGTVKRFLLKGTTRLSSGRHEIRIQILRPFISLPKSPSPRQYLDNCTLTLRTK